MAAPHVLVVGFSTRAMAESAVRAGYTVTSIDAFGDLDHRAHHVMTASRDLGLPYRPLDIARAARTVTAESVAYVASFENHPDAVATLARGRKLLGNPPSVLRRARDPAHVAHVLRDHGFPTLDVRRRPPTDAAPAAGWLVKPLASGGGHSIERWRPGRRLCRTEYLQRFIRGEPASLVFASDGQSIVPLALSRQLVGETEFGSSGFQYCGSMLGPTPTATFARGDALVDTAACIARALARELHLVGVNGIDFIVRDGVPYVTEVNPRYSASMELAERAFGVSVFDMHVQACSGRLSPSVPSARGTGGSALGKAVLFARRPVTVGDTRPWLACDEVRDVPHPGERIARGSPVCTIFAQAGTVAACHAALVRRARTLYDEIEGRGRKSA